MHNNHDNIKEIIEELNIEKVDGSLLDLGVSSYQLDEKNRGFSYLGENELDMRMDKTQELTAKIVVNTYEEEQLANLIYEYGEEKFSRRIAKNICEYRKQKQIETTKELVEIIEKSIPKAKQKDGQPYAIEIKEEVETTTKNVKAVKKGKVKNTTNTRKKK